MKGKLLDVLKKLILEQGPPGLYDYDDESSEESDITIDFSTGKAEKTVSNEIIDQNYTFLIKPSTKRGSPYGPRNGKQHKGVDYPVSSGTLIVYLKNGTVVRSGFIDPEGWGNLVEIKDSEGDITRYAHLSEILVTSGQKVLPGTIIGATGGDKGEEGAGNSRGAHLHFEYLKGSSHTDPGSGLDEETFRFLNPSDKNKMEMKPKKEQSKKTLSSFDISGSYEVEKTHKDWADRLHSFERRRSDGFGGRMSTKINEQLLKLYNEGINPDVKDITISITKETDKYVVNWDATIGQSTDGKAYMGISTVGSAGNNADSRAEGQLSKMKRWVSGAEDYTEVLDYKSPTNPIYIRQFFYKYTLPEKYPPHH